MGNKVVSEDELEELELEKERLVWREFWTYKNGGVYPEGFDKTVVRKTTLAEKSRESVLLWEEFADFVKNKKTDN